MGDVSYNPFAPGFFANPYPHYDELRTHDPVHLTSFGFWLLTRYDDVVAAYEHPKLSRDPRLWEGYAFWRQGTTDGPLEKMMDNWLVLIDPPRHTPLRAIHESVFTRRRFDDAVPLADGLVKELLDAAAGDGSLDVVRDLADPLPVYLLCDMLAIPRADRDRFVAWSHAVAATTEPLLSEDVLEAGADAVLAMKDYFGKLVDDRRRDPGDDLVSALATTEHDGARLDGDELLDSLIFLFQAGHPTTTHLIALGVHSLLRNPDQLDRLRSDPSLVESAVEELARYDGPVQMNGRTATEDMEFLGVEVRRGQLVRVCLGAANRDPERFPSPNELDVARSDNEHLGFGRGIHYCVAAALGRVMARVALAALLERAPNLALATEDVEFKLSAANRGIVSLPVRL